MKVPSLAKHLFSILGAARRKYGELRSIALLQQYLRFYLIAYRDDLDIPMVQYGCTQPM